MAARAAITSLAALLVLLAQPGSAQEREPAEVWAERTRNAIAAAAAGQHSEALTLFRAAMLAAEALAESDPRRATAMSNLGLQRLSGGDIEGSGNLLKDALELRRQLLGQDHGRVAESLVNLAAWHEAQGDFDEAELALGRALLIREKLTGPAHPEALAILDRQMLNALASGKSSEAERFGKRAVAADPGDNPQASARRRQRLAALLVQDGAWSEAEELLREAIELAPGKDLRIDLSRILLAQNNYLAARDVLSSSPIEQAQKALIDAKELVDHDEFDAAHTLLDQLIADLAAEETATLLGDALFLRAVTRRKSAEFEGALEDLERLLEMETQRQYGAFAASRRILNARLATEEAAGMFEEAQATRALLEELTQ